MDVSLASSAVAAQAGSLQLQVATSVLKSNIDSQSSDVLTLLGATQQNGSSLANVAAGIGGNLDVSA